MLEIEIDGQRYNLINFRGQYILQSHDQTETIQGHFSWIEYMARNDPGRAQRCLREDDLIVYRIIVGIVQSPDTIEQDITNRRICIQRYEPSYKILADQIGIESDQLIIVPIPSNNNYEIRTQDTETILEYVYYAVHPNSIRLEERSDVEDELQKI